MKFCGVVIASPESEVGPPEGGWPDFALAPLGLAGAGDLRSQNHSLTCSPLPACCRHPLPHLTWPLRFSSAPHPGWQGLSIRARCLRDAQHLITPTPAWHQFQPRTRLGQDQGLRPCEAWPCQARPRPGHAWPGPGLARPGQARAMPRQARRSQSKPGQVRAWPNLVGTQTRPWQYEARQGPGKGHRQASQDKPRPGHSRPGPDQAKPGQNRTKAGQVSSGQSQARTWSGRARTKTRDWPGQGLGQARRGLARL